MDSKYTIYRQVLRNGYLLVRYEVIQQGLDYEDAISWVDRENELAGDWHLYICSRNDLTIYGEEARHGNQ